MSSKLLRGKLPCPKCPSSDAYHEYSDGHGYCYSCGFVSNSSSNIDSHVNEECTGEFFPWRGISKQTMEFWDTWTKIDASGKPIELWYPYPNEAFKVRKLDKKEFYSVGPMAGKPGLFGKERFPAGCAKSITIVEGEGDALAFTEVFGRTYPVVSPKNGASGSRRDCTAERAYLNSFDRIYLCLDSDGPGQKASSEIAQLFDFNKVYHVKLEGYKDALEFLETGNAEQFKRIWWNSRRFLPEGVTSSFRDIDSIIDSSENEKGTPWPFKTLNHKTGGIKPGRSYLVSGLEGIGKTEFCHAVEYHLMHTTDKNIGIIHIEEPIDENIKRKVGYHLHQPVHFEDAVVSKGEIKAAYRELAKRDDRIHYYNHFGSDDPDSILDTIRFLVAACSCEYIFLDNVTIIVTGRTTEDERRDLDYLSTRLEMMVKELKFSLVMISHENDFEQTRGSRNISKACDVWINLKRDTKNESDFVRNIIDVTMFKGRGCRGTGPAGRLVLNPETHTLSELDKEVPVE